MQRARILIAVSLFAVFVLAYGHTCSLSVSWKNFSEDSGDLLAASYTLGIPHPTGYPLYVLVGRLFSLAMPGSIAFRITLLSLLCGALAPVFLFLALARLLPRSSGLVAAAAAALSLGFSLYFWSQAVVAEVYALNVFFFSLIAYLLVRWTYPQETSTPTRYFILAAYVLGLSFANHMLSILSLLFAVVLVLSGPARRRLNPSAWMYAALCFFVPLTIYAFLPLRSMRNPELDWGNPETWNQFKWVVTGEQYRFRFMAQPLAQSLAKLWPGPFLASGWATLFLSAVGVFSRRLGGSLRAALIAAIVADLALVALYDIPDFPTYFLPAGFAICFLAGAGFESVLCTLTALLPRITRTTRIPIIRAASAFLAAALLVAVVAPVAVHNGRRADAATDLYPYVFARAAFRIVEPNALIVSEYDGRTFALWFFQQTEFKKSHPDCIVILKYLLVWPWYVDNLKKLHPDLSLPHAGPMDGAMLSLVASNIDKRPIYTVRDDPTLKPFYHLKAILGGETELFKVGKAGSPR